MVVGRLAVLGSALSITQPLLALLLAPVATELPETLNAAIWVRRYRLALTNANRSMMIQATVPTALGLCFTPRLLARSLVLSAGITLLAVSTLFVAFRRGVASRGLLAAVLLLYALFSVLLVALHPG